MTEIKLLRPWGDEPIGHLPICRWIDTRELDPRCPKCVWLAEHDTQTERGKG